jgi:hypothetical protein
MDYKHPVFETTILGVLVAIFAWTSFFIINPDDAIRLADFVWKTFANKNTGASEAIARVAVFGVALSALGSLVRVASIVANQDNHFKDEGRKILAREIWKTLHGCKEPLCCLKALMHDFEENPDPLFVWSQYSDQEQALREWGRTRMWYVYLGENWLMAGMVGIPLGGALGFLTWIPAAFPLWAWQSVALAFVAIVFVLGRIAMKKLIEHNIDDERKMVAVYVAGILSEDLRNRFLKPLTERKSKNEKASNEVDPTNRHPANN